MKTFNYSSSNIKKYPQMSSGHNKCLNQVFSSTLLIRCARYKGNTITPRRFGLRHFNHCSWYLKEKRTRGFKLDLKRARTKCFLANERWLNTSEKTINKKIIHGKKFLSNLTRKFLVQRYQKKHVEGSAIIKPNHEN